ncbi:MATE family efflux transporter [candidate division KSB3 bacterium]|uniref:MATE family efflux transporter n=1 Tax=candidate division KSB3 bacterium TaxID=2044937 RepID=A0A2G6E8G0_9BACT|nr:MAG: MATE family efflux transporter [candidate division KSB3 bacterium]PIE30673.1 MAG: MATE family efflux transporter [candidate division KSB3 bacterium]
MKDDSGLTIAPIPILLRKIAIPAGIGLFFNTMYNVVDTYFAGLLSTQVLAALSLSFPVFFIIISVSNGISTGATALIGSALGSNDAVEARLYAVQGISFAFLTGVLLTGFGWIVSPSIFSALGASGEYLRDCLLYMDTIFAGSLFFVLIQIFNSMLNAQGDTRTFRNFLMLGFVLNVFLDPWCIYGGFAVPAMGVRGVAVSTVLIHILGCIYLAWRAYGSGLLAGGHAREFLPRRRHFKEIAQQGFPSSLNYMTIALGVFVISYFLSKFGQEAVAAYGVAIRIEQIVLLPMIGLNIATLSIVAQNYGAKDFGRIRETLQRALQYGGIVSIIGCFAVVVFGSSLMGVFSEDLQVIRIGKAYLRIDAFALYAYVILFVHLAVLQGMKRPMFALIIGAYRQITAPYLVFYLLTEILPFGLLGIWWGIFLVTWSAAIVTYLYARRVILCVEIEESS